MHARSACNVKIRLRGYITVPDADLNAVRAALPEHIRRTRDEAGCLCFDVTTDPSDPHRFDVYEEFVDRLAFERHQTRVRNSEWGRISANVSRHYEIDEFE